MIKEYHSNINFISNIGNLVSGDTPPIDLGRQDWYTDGAFIKPRMKSLCVTQISVSHFKQKVYPHLFLGFKLILFKTKGYVRYIAGRFHCNSVKKSRVKNASLWLEKGSSPRVVRHSEWSVDWPQLYSDYLLQSSGWALPAADKAVDGKGKLCIRIAVAAVLRLDQSFRMPLHPSF